MSAKEVDVTATHKTVITLSLVLAACSSSAAISPPDTSTMGGGGEGGSPLIAPSEGVVPCPVTAGPQCQQWFGLDRGQTYCLADADAEPPPEFGDCLLVNPGVLPAAWCCQRTDAQKFPACATRPCDDVEGAQVTCAAFLAGDGDQAVPHCMSPTLPGMPDSHTDAYRCVPDAAWGRCGAHSPELLCCLH